MNFFGFIILSFLSLISDSIPIGYDRVDTVSYYYNTGVEYYNTGDYLKAAAYFYFTWKLDPWNSVVRESKKRAFDKIGRMNTENPEIYLLPVKNLFIWMHLFFLILGAVFFIMAVLKKKKKFIISSCLFIFISMSLLLYYHKIQRLEKNDEVFIIKKAEIREQPVLGSEPIGIAEDGFQADIIDERGDWIKIKFNMYEGWIKKENTLSL